jgi:hypothetical protein
MVHICNPSTPGGLGRSISNSSSSGLHRKILSPKKQTNKNKIRNGKHYAG